jgi:hypothetical protein
MAWVRVIKGAGMKYLKYDLTVRLGTAVAALCAATTTPVAAQIPTVTVAVFADHYVFAGRSFDDLDRLEDAIAAAQLRGLQLEACGDQTARAQRAAAHRFRNLYLDLRSNGKENALCQPASDARVAPASQRFGQRPYGIQDEAVDLWWSTISMP